MLQHTKSIIRIGTMSFISLNVVWQVWDFWMQVSQSLNISANSMVASALGSVRSSLTSAPVPQF